jgi:hypothetical protein
MTMLNSVKRSDTHKPRSRLTRSINKKWVELEQRLVNIRLDLYNTKSLAMAKYIINYCKLNDLLIELYSGNNSVEFYNTVRNAIEEATTYL